jgi:hypothetical protein
MMGELEVESWKSEAVAELIEDAREEAREVSSKVLMFLDAAARREAPIVRDVKIGPQGYKSSIRGVEKMPNMLEAWIRLHVQVLPTVPEEHRLIAEKAWHWIHVVGIPLKPELTEAYIALCRAVKEHLELDPFPRPAERPDNWMTRTEVSKAIGVCVSGVTKIAQSKGWKYRGGGGRGHETEYLVVDVIDYMDQRIEREKLQKREEKPLRRRAGLL